MPVNFSVNLHINLSSVHILAKSSNRPAKKYDIFVVQYFGMTFGTLYKMTFGTLYKNTIWHLSRLSAENRHSARSLRLRIYNKSLKYMATVEVI